MDNKPLIVIIGPTASGKTSLAIDLAEAYGGEIICADSRSIYKGSDIGTAKPTNDDRARVPHWGLDLVNPGDYFSAADFKKYAQDKIREIRSRGNVPFLVGGTGLYIDAIIFDYQFGKEVDVVERTTLNSMTLEQLYDYCLVYNVTLPENKKNKRYVIRAIEKKDSNVSKNKEPIINAIIVGITTPKERLRERIESRVEQLLENGVVDEAKLLSEKYGWENEALKSNAYKVSKLYLLDEIKYNDIKTQNSTLDWKLAKRQLTWFRRNPFIKWFSIDQAKKYISDRLAKLY